MLRQRATAVQNRRWNKDEAAPRRAGRRALQPAAKISRHAGINSFQDIRLK